MRLCFPALLFTVGLQLPEHRGTVCSPVFLSLFVTWPACCVLSKLKLSLSLSRSLHRRDEKKGPRA